MRLKKTPNLLLLALQIDLKFPKRSWIRKQILLDSEKLIQSSDYEFPLGTEIKEDGEFFITLVAILLTASRNPISAPRASL